jgi:hypothetical protein
VLYEPEYCLDRTSFEEDGVDLVEVGEVCVDLKYPIWLRQYDGADVEVADSLAQERFVLNPSDYIVKTPGHVEEDCGAAEIPAVYGGMCEDERSVESSHYQL